MLHMVIIGNTTESHYSDHLDINEGIKDISTHIEGIITDIESSITHIESTITHIEGINNLYVDDINT